MFLNAIMLAGIGGAVLPLVLHLMNRARYRTVEWGAMMFLRGDGARQQQSTRLKQLILLLVRMALVALLAVALARPLAARAVAPLGMTASTTAVIILDRSPGMGFEVHGHTRFDEARDVVLQILAGMHKGDQAALLMPGDESDNPYAQPTGDLQSIASFVTGLSPSYGKADIAEAMSAAAGVFERDPSLNQQLLIVSSRQALDWEHVTASFGKSWRQRFGKHHVPPKTFFVQVGGTEADNLAVESLSFVNPPAIRDQPIDVEATVKNYGPAPQTGVPFRIHVGAQTVLDETLDVGPGAETTVRAPMKLSTLGSHIVTAQLQSTGLAYDDRLDASIDVVDPIGVLIVSGDSPSLQTSAAQSDAPPAPPGNASADKPPGTISSGQISLGPISTEADFIRLALEPFHGAGRAGPNIAAVDVIGAADDWAEFSSRQYRVVILANVPYLTEAQARALAQHVYGGGGVLIAPGDLTRADSYDAMLYRDGAGVLPASLSAARPAAPNASVADDNSDLGNGAGTTLAMVDLTHPALQFLKGQADPLPAAKILRYFPATPRSPDARVLGSYADGEPFLIEGRSGRGRVLLTTTSLDAKWGSLPLSNFYLPFVQSAVRYLAASEAADRNLAPGEPIAATLDDSVDPATVRIRLPDLTEVVPAVERSGDQTLVRYDRTQMPGEYRVLTRGGPRISYEVQASREESDLTPMTAQRLDELRQSLALTIVDTSKTSIAAAMGNDRQVRELWPLLLSGVLILAVGEMGLARLWGNREK